MRAQALHLILANLLAAAPLLATEPAHEAAPPPRLAVVISIDQMRYDYLERFRAHFAPGGFARLLDGGVDFRHCTYRYAATKTAVGHATILTGCQPMVHGIVANHWIQSEDMRGVVAVEDAEAPPVGVAPSTQSRPGGAADPRSGRSPRRLLCDTVGDRLKAHYGAQARVFGISNKDRAAILMGGHRADSAYWEDAGRFVSSAYYQPSLPAWVEHFNARQLPAAAFGRTWERLLEPEVYATLQGPDDAPGEMIGVGLDREFPHRIDGGETSPEKLFHFAYSASPFSTEVLTAFARELIAQENLGSDDVPDLLCIGYSQVDIIGHCYGPDSHEVLDSLLRLDRELEQLLTDLDQRVGAGRFVVVLTADHGVAPLPERASQAHPQGEPSRRIVATELEERMNREFARRFGTPIENEPWLALDNQGFHLRPEPLAASGLQASALVEVLRDMLRADPIIAEAYTREEILAAAPSSDSLLDLLRRSFHPLRGQDVVYVTREYFVEKPEIGSNHGTPWLYDRHVPQVWYGAGLAPAVRLEPVDVVDIAPTLAALLSLPPATRGCGRRLALQVR